MSLAMTLKRGILGLVSRLSGVQDLLPLGTRNPNRWRPPRRRA